MELALTAKGAFCKCPHIPKSSASARRSTRRAWRTCRAKSAGNSPACGSKIASSRAKAWPSPPAAAACADSRHPQGRRRLSASRSARSRSSCRPWGATAAATAEGQRRVIESYGVTEGFCGCPIRASMETVIVCRTAEGFPVHFDRHAYEADHVLVCGRVKPHTDFTGEIESGLMKMMLIGLGKHEGAKIYHRAIQDYSFGQIVRSVAGHVLKSCRIVAGLAVVENGYDETAAIAAVPPQEFESREKELLLLAEKLMPRLPFDRVDIADHRRDRQEHQRHGHGHERRRPQVQRPQGRPGRVPPGQADFRARPDRRDARQRRRHRHGRVLHAARHRPDRPARHALELPHGGACFGCHAAARLSHRPRGPGRGAAHDRNDGARTGQNHLDPQHARHPGSGVLHGVPGASPVARGSGNPLAAAGPAVRRPGQLAAGRGPIAGD